ncbi:MAG: zinc-ribbon domain-containing protein [Ruminococcus sp.]|nr:zinc-ribbon domain-containing protein [Ruminococcus sp.]
MFCHNCGHELENGAKFCNNCGTPQQTQNTSQPQSAIYEPASTPVAQPQQETPSAVPYAQPPQSDAYQPQQTAPQYAGSVPYNANLNPQPPVKPKKTSTGCIVGIIIGIVVFVIAIVTITGILGFVVAKDVMNDTVSDFSSYSDFSDYTTDYEFDDDVVTGLTYEEIFETNYIVEVPAVFLTEETCSLAYAEPDGYVEKSEYGFENDVIIEMVDTYYFPIDGYTKEEADAYATLTKGEFKAEESLSFCTVTYSQTADYFIATVKYKDVDDKKNLKAMYEAGLLDDGDIDYLSMEETEINYLADGFVKK